LGVAWYLYPDEAHNSDGKHITYLNAPDLWRYRDPHVFDGLKQIVNQKRRAISAVTNDGIISPYRIHDTRLDYIDSSYLKREVWRRSWFESMLVNLKKSEIVFADPDNGICDTDKFKYHNKKNWKRMPLNEVKKLSENRTAIIYHHNSRYKGGHVAEILHWLSKLPNNSFAIRYRAYSSRTFFVVNFENLHMKRAQDWILRFGPKAELITSPYS